MHNQSVLVHFQSRVHAEKVRDFAIAQLSQAVFMADLK